MSGHPAFEELEALSLGELPAEAAGRVEAHAAGCAGCGRELAWLRAEVTLLQRRPTPPVSPALWEKVQERVYAPIPIARARRRTWVGAAVAVAAAAALAVFVRAKPQQPGPFGDAGVLTEESPNPVDTKAVRALDKAAGDYRSALTVLEQEYAKGRDRLDARTQKRWDDSFARARGLVDASAQASNDVGERLKLLDGTAVMVRSLRHALEDTEEVTR
jgi:hypothetical protein